MITRILYKEEQKLYDSVISHPVQTWDWGEFQKLTGKNVQRWQIVENGQVVGQIQGFEHKLPGLGNYFANRNDQKNIRF